MNSTTYGILLGTSAGGVLLCAVATLWLRSTGAVAGWLALQGSLLAAAAASIGVHAADPVLAGTAVLVFGVKGVLVPILVHKALRLDAKQGERPGDSLPGDSLPGDSLPVVNVPSSLVCVGLLVLLASFATRHLAGLVPAVPGRLLPAVLATFLIGFFTMVSRRHAVAQIVGILLVDNGTALFAFLVTSGVPALVEFGVSLDILLVVVVLQVLTVRMRTKFGALDVDQLRELHD